MKRVLVPLFGDKRDDLTLNAATKLARAGGIHVDARLFMRDPLSNIPYVGEGISALSAQQFTKAANENALKCEKRARVNFDNWCELERISINDRIENGQTSANFEVVLGPLPDVIAPCARIADINVFARTNGIDDTDWGALIQTALFESGRPTLLVPPVIPATIATRIIIAWNGSTEAARAVAITMPLLQQAEAVFVVTVNDDEDQHDPSELAATLAMNGIIATPLSTTANKKSISEAMISKAKKIHSDMIIIGAYSHNRFSQMVFGGVTRELVDGSDIPILMTH